MKKILLIILFYSPLLKAQTPEFMFNGAADVVFRFPPRGSGGRAIVHADNNVLTFNFGGDFTGGTKLGNGFYTTNEGNAYFNSWAPYGSNQGDFFVDVEPGTRILRTRNWNTVNPNIGATGIHTGSGYFEGNVGIGTSSPAAPLTVFGNAYIYPRRVGSGDARLFNVTHTLSNPSFISNDYPIVLSTGGGNQPLILDAARIGLGTTNPDEKLTVKGKIHAEEVKVDLSVPGPDYVFNDDYQLIPLSEIQSYVKTNKHLPEIPSAKEMEANGINLSEMNMLLLKKVEELTLHIIKQDERIKKLEDKHN